MKQLKFYQLEQEPFSNAPVSRFYFESKQTQSALLRLTRVIEEMKGLAVLVGDIGAGKTTLARKLLDSLPETEYEAALLVIIHAGVNADWLLRRIAQQLGVEEPAKEKLALLGQLYHRLLEISESGKKAVVLIDEAQMLQTKEIMEEFRGILNLEIPEKKLITIIFFGLSEIEENLKLDPPLLQRVAVRCRLNPMDLASTIEYIQHRLALAGAKEPIFDDAALELIYKYSQGSPRLINTLADNAIFEGALVQAKVIGRDIIERVAQDLGIEFIPAAQTKKEEVTNEHNFLRSTDTDEFDPAQMIDDLDV